MKQVLTGCLVAFLATTALAANEQERTTRQLKNVGLPTITYVSDSDGRLSEVLMEDKPIVSYDWSVEPDTVSVRFFSRWRIVTTVLADGSATQLVSDSRGTERAFGAILAHGRSFARPVAVVDALAADFGMSSGWQQDLQTISPNDVRLPTAGKTVTIHYHSIERGVRVGETDNKPLLWDIDLPLELNGRLGQVVPSRLIVTSSGAVQLAAETPFEDGIESIWSNDPSGSESSFRTLHAAAITHSASLAPHAEMRMMCDASYICTYSDGCPSCGGCSTTYYYCDTGTGGGGYDDGTGAGAGGSGSTGTNQISSPTLHTAVDNALGNATAKLGSTQCQAMIRNNTDAAGISLWDVMSAYASDPSRYIALQVTFRSGDGIYDMQGNIPCSAIAGELAWEYAVGVHEVQVCSEFSTLTVGAGGSTLIHEMLHTLGLPENPPKSAEIQQMVVDACGN